MINNIKTYLKVYDVMVSKTDNNILMYSMSYIEEYQTRQKVCTIVCNNKDNSEGFVAYLKTKAF